MDFTARRPRPLERDVKRTCPETAQASVWNDNCEYDSMVDKDCRCYFEGKGGTIDSKICYVQHHVHISNEAIHETFDNTRPYVVCRSGHAGIQNMHRPGQATTNLLESLKYNIATILGMAYPVCKPGL